MPIHSKWWCSNTLYTSNMDVGCSQRWYGTICDPPYPNFPNFGPHLHRYNSVTVHQCAHPQHMKVLKHLHTSNMDVGCSQQGFAASIITPRCHLGSSLPQFPKIWPQSSTGIRVKGAPICPSTEYPIWMCNAVSGGLQTESWHHNVSWALPYPNIEKVGPHLLSQANQLYLRSRALNAWGRKEWYGFW
jgi:hypothetical protein